MTPPISEQPATTMRIGDLVDEVVFTVEAGKIAEFARATHTTDPVHTDGLSARDAGFASLPATATHVVVSGHYRDQRAMVERLGLTLERVVVGSVRWRYRRPLVAGDVLRGVRRVVGDERRTTRSGQPMRVITLETTFVGRSGEPAVLLTETVLERGTTG